MSGKSENAFYPVRGKAGGVRTGGAVGAGGAGGGGELRGPPGCGGGGLMMNAGAYGRSIAQILEWAEIVSFEGGLHRVAAREIRFSYRESGFPLRGIVVRAGFRMEPAPKDRVFTRMKELNEKRRAAQPWGERTFGSIFRNPGGEEAAGRLLAGAGVEGG